MIANDELSEYQKSGARYYTLFLFIRLGDFEMMEPIVVIVTHILERRVCIIIVVKILLMVPYKCPTLGRRHEAQ